MGIWARSLGPKEMDGLLVPPGNMVARWRRCPDDRYTPLFYLATTDLFCLHK